LRLVVSSALALAAISLSACGSNADHTPAPGAPSNVITQSELEKPAAGSVERAFVEFWSDLQFQSWAEVASFYSPAFRESIGTAVIVGAKKLNGSSYPDLKPLVVSVEEGRGLTTIKYSLQFIDGTKELSSINWQKQAGNWEIVYDSRLDSELNQFAENRVELAKNGALPTDVSEITPEAAKAGAAASQAQARFLQQELSASSP
jgi:hypothetical protein